VGEPVEESVEDLGSSDLALVGGVVWLGLEGVGRNSMVEAAGD